MTHTIITERLALSHASYADCAFIVELLNEPSFRRFIGDKGVRNLDDARRYLHDACLAHYAMHGYGLYRVGLRDDDAPLGICGLVKRDAFPEPDIGFAFLAAHWAKGYAFEAATAVLQEGRQVFGLTRILAIVDSENESSVRLLEKLGFGFERMVRMPGEAVDIRQYAIVY